MRSTARLSETQRVALARARFAGLIERLAAKGVEPGEMLAAFALAAFAHGPPDPQAALRCAFEVLETNNPDNRERAAAIYAYMSATLTDLDSF